MKINEELQKEFDTLTDRVLEIYDLADGSDLNERKVVCGTDENGNILMLFKGNTNDAYCLRDFLYSPEMEV